MDGEGVAGWSAVAAQWSSIWGSFPQPVWQAIIGASGIGAGSRVLDVGCGSGEFLRALGELGAIATGIDPAAGMVEVARSHCPGAQVRLGSSEQLPWPDACFDVVTAINSLQFADDVEAALDEARRVTVPGGCVAIANWAEGARNDMNTIEEAVRLAAGDELLPDGDLRLPGGLERLLALGGLELVTAGIVDAPWQAADDTALVHGILLGEDPDGIAAATPIVVEAARPFRAGSGYRLVNALRFALGRVPG